MERSGAATAGDEENIGSSQPVEENATDTKGMTATAANDDSKDPSSQESLSRRNKLLIIFAAVIVAHVLAIVLILIKLWNNDGSPNKMMSTPITLQNISDILGVEDLDSLSTTSPEFQALEWLAYEDPLLESVATSEGSDKILSERYSIVVMYYATNGTSWENQFNFLSGTSVCDWNNDIPFGESGDQGIYCNEQGTVVGIAFWFNGLSGTIPSQLGELLSMELLDLRHNNLRGTIPDALGALTQLTYLYVRWNELTGTIPGALGALTKLTLLHVDDNELAGTIPDVLAALMQLRYLDVSGNELTGTIPEELSNLTNLRFLDVSNNQLTGSLDPIFCPRPTALATLWADCAEPNPEITCSCCTLCTGRN